MKTIKRFCMQIVPVVTCILFLGLSAQAASLEKIKVVKIAPADEAAVVKVPGSRELKLVKVGDRLGDKGGVIKEIAKGRVVVEEGEGDARETVIISVGKGTQRLERIKKK